MKVLVKEDFSDFKLTEYPYDHDHSALGEYHCVIPSGYMGDFYDPISLHQWRSLGGSWMITEQFGKHYLEQNRGDNAKGHFEDVSAILALRNTIYVPYEVTFNIRLFETKNLCGFCFNYIHNRKYDSIAFDGTKAVIYHKDQEQVSEYASVDFALDSLKTYEIKASISDNVRLYVNGKLLLVANIPFVPHKFAFIAKSATRYSDLLIEVSDENYLINKDLKDDELKKLEAKRDKYSKIECIKKIDLKQNGSGRQFRFGLDKNGEAVFLFAQHQKRMYRDAFARLSCLTAFDINGNVKWQIGEANGSVDNTLISCDLPFQIADINGDGINEVIFAMDFMVYIVSLDDGHIISQMPTPYVKGDELVGEYPYDHLNPDGLRVADFEGLGYKGDFILKDRYKNVWAYRASDFKLLWRYNHKNTGHFPYIHDFNNDGIDEMYVGYDMVSSKGEIQWSLPINSDHTDEIIYASTKDGEPKRLYLASGNEGFNIVNLDGTIYRSNNVGHAQRISISSYDKTRDDLQVAVTSFWGADMLIYLFSGDGNLLAEKEMMANGNLVSPVAYDGENELILSNMHPKFGGLMDSDLDIVVEFPDDNHPYLTAEVLDIDNDGIDEILCWDQNRLWIYKARKFKTGNKYDRYPDNAFSNYRGEYLIKR